MQLPNAYSCFDSLKHSTILGYNSLHKLILAQYFLIIYNINTPHPLCLY